MFERDLTRKEFEIIQEIEGFVREKHRHEEGHDYSHAQCDAHLTARNSDGDPHCHSDGHTHRGPL